MFRSSKRFFSCKIIRSSSVPSRREGLDVIQLCAVIIGLPVSLFRLSYDAGLSSLCTLGSSFMQGSCSLSCGVGSNSRELSWLVITVENRFLSWPSSVWELVMVCLQLKLSIRLQVERSEKCCSYSVENHEVGTKAQPMFLSETVSITSLSFCTFVM